LVLILLRCTEECFLIRLTNPMSCSNTYVSDLVEFGFRLDFGQQ
jgi:hypothetical protein